MSKRIIPLALLAGISMFHVRSIEAQQCSRGNQDGQSTTGTALQAALRGSQFGSPSANQLGRSVNQYGATPQLQQQLQNAYLQQMVMQNAAARAVRLNASRQRRLAAVQARQATDSPGLAANTSLARK